MKPKLNIVKIFINFLIVIAVTIEAGITIGYYMLTKIDYNRFKENYIIDIAK